MLYYIALTLQVEYENLHHVRKALKIITVISPGVKCEQILNEMELRSNLRDMKSLIDMRTY